MVLHIFSDDEAWDFFRWNGNMLRKHTTVIVFTEEGDVEVLGRICPRRLRLRS